MTRIVVAAAVLTAAAWAGTAVAQAPEIPKHQCDPKPEWPGKLASDNVRRGFDRRLQAYGDCIRAYVEVRKAAIKANEGVAQAAIDEYNGLLAKVRADREAEMPK